MKPTKTLKEYLLVFDNCKNPETIFSRNRSWEELLLDKPFWLRLHSTIYDDEILNGFFESLAEAERELHFGFAVQCMLRFTQANFTGPDLTAAESNFFSDLFPDEDFGKRLSFSDEDINVNTKYPILLFVADRIFKFCHFDAVLNCWWRMRVIMIRQHILEELHQELLAEADCVCSQIKEFEVEKHLMAQLKIELAQLYSVFRIVPKLQMYLEAARNILGIEYSLQGKLGKRTKFQSNDIAQLMLQITLCDDNNCRLPVQEIEIAKNIVLDDDLRLDTIKYSQDADNTVIKIPDMEQKLLVAVIKEMLVSKPLDNLYYEEVKPFIDIIVSQKSTWAVQATILLIRCKLEAHHKRTIERSLMQCEEICKCIRQEQPHPLNRVGGVYATGLQPIWKSEAQLADVMLNLGMVKASLDIYMRLQLWEEVIVCYTLLQMRHKATEIIKQQLDTNPTIKLWCLLGDATDDVKCYQKAWEMSEGHSSRAQRHWGQFHYQRKQYAECIEHFEKSVNINPLQPIVWLCYGFAALEMEDWQTAARAYKQYTNLEPGNFEAWNNLAKAHIKLGNKQAAHQALHDALKCNYDNWKVWDNLMVVSADLANFSDVIHAYHRILDLKEKHLDVEVVRVLVCAISQADTNDRLLQKARELLGRITAIHPGESSMWELYADLASDPLTRAQRLQRSLKGLMRSQWDKDLDVCREVARIGCKLGDAVLDTQITRTDPIVYSVGLSLGSIASALKRQLEGDSCREHLPVLENLVEKCKARHLGS